MRIHPLNRKLFRDVWGMKGQALAIALVIASGVAMYVMYLSNFESLRRTQAAFYERQRFADVFAGAKRAPERLTERLAEIPGVAALDTRVVADVNLDVPGILAPVRGRLISIPAAGRPRLNDVFLRRGRWIDPGRPDEILVSEAFANAHHFQPGASLAAIINGRRRSLQIVGIALSPEYVYSIPPGEIIPDDRRFGIIWMERKALASAFNMEGGFNDLALQLLPGTSRQEVITRIDRMMANYGGLGAIPRSLQFSHWTLDSELKQLQNFGFIIPMIFLAVAAFVLNVALTRALALQRTQIAALKALGYTNLELAWHYLKWALLIAAFGALLGLAIGAMLGREMIGLYNEYFRFPILDYRLSTGVVMSALLLSMLMGTLGALASVRRAVRIPPAEAMRPEAPAHYRISLMERGPLRGRFSYAARMIIRNLERQPLRALTSLLGIALAVSILIVGLLFIDLMDEIKIMQFSFVQRQDVTLSFVEPASVGTLYELRSMPGVERVEPMRTVPVRLHYGHRFRNVSIIGLPAVPELNRIIDRSGRVVALPGNGLLMSKTLADLLEAKIGSRVELEVLEGKRPVREAAVSGLVDEYLGLSVYMNQSALHKLMREDEIISGAYLKIDKAESARLYQKIKNTPRIAGMSLTSEALRSFERTMDQNMGLQITISVAFAAIIAFGVVYNAARISLSERSRELASLRVLGLTRGEISLILLGELALLTFAALPLGVLLGHLMSKGILAAVESELYRFPYVLTMQNIARSCLTVVAAAAFSGFVVRRKLDRLDLIAVLKTPE